MGDSELSVPVIHQGGATGQYGPNDIKFYASENGLLLSQLQTIHVAVKVLIIIIKSNPKTNGKLQRNEYLAVKGRVEEAK